jgi:hypothetical protein
MKEIEIENNKWTQEALQRLRKALGYDETSVLDAFNFIALAAVRINRLTAQLNGTWNPEEATEKMLKRKP